ncbi:hypothetical protein MMC19_003893 [Ptychographa xylographoides]|nr:hypothetical protein [Ptychographa xylographoides]
MSGPHVSYVHFDSTTRFYKLVFSSHEIDGIRQYRRAAHYNVTHRRRQNFYALPTSHWQLLAAAPFNILGKFDRADDAIDANAAIASAILEAGLKAFGINHEASEQERRWEGTAKSSDMDKARSTIRQLFRDWSADGIEERTHCYSPVLLDLLNVLPGPARENVKVLVPGAGLGRLVFEICKLGYDVEGNEISYHQLMTSNWILNQISVAEKFDLYPFALTFSNHVERDHQFKRVEIPDVHPGTELDIASAGYEVHAFERMSMTAADFVVLYGDLESHKKFDAVITVFFLDTAPNVLRYIEVIRNCLKDGGYWINLGPLLWHFEDSREQGSGGTGTVSHRRGSQGVEPKVGIQAPGSIELTDSEVLLLVEHLGFQIEQHEIRDGCGYSQDAESMMQSMYKVSHWIAKKVGAPDVS